MNNLQLDNWYHQLIQRALLGGSIDQEEADRLIEDFNKDK